MEPGATDLSKRDYLAILRRAIKEFRNDNMTGHNWAAFTLKGSGTNPDAVDAEVTLEAGGRIQRRYLTTARGYLSQSDLTVTFVLGGASVADRVTVRWPGKAGRTQTWEGLAAGRRHELKEAR